MSLTSKQLEELEKLTSSKFQQHTCEVCGEPFYSAKPAKHCSARCSANAYRVRISQRNESPKPLIEEEDASSELEQELNEKIKKTKTKHSQK